MQIEDGRASSSSVPPSAREPWCRAARALSGLPDRFYAVKILRTDQPGVKDEMKAVEREREVLALLARECRGSHHRQLYTYLVASGEEVNTLCLVMPAALGGELFDLLRDHGEMAESAAQFYAACLVLALQHLHSLGVAYRDLKAENVLLTGGHCFPDAGWPVLTDMGLANFAKADLLHSFCGTPSFIAPEVATNVGYSTAIDWWGLGVLVCQMLTLRTPFDGVTGKATVANVIANRRTLPRPLASLVSPNAASFIDALLQPDPTERPCAQPRIPSSGASTGRVSRSAKCPRPTPPRAPRARPRWWSRWPLIRSRPRATWRNRAPTALRPRLRRCPRWHCLRQAKSQQNQPQ